MIEEIEIVQRNTEDRGVLFAGLIVERNDVLEVETGKSKPNLIFFKGISSPPLFFRRYFVYNDTSLFQT